MPEEKKNRNNYYIIALLLVVLFIIFLIWLLNQGSETYVTNDDNRQSTMALVCTADNLDDAFFHSETANDESHEIKIAFVGDLPSSIFYVYEGKYDNNELATRAKDSMYVDYYEYLHAGTPAESSISKNFATIDNTSKISLYTDASKVNYQTSRLFSLTNDEANDFSQSSSATLKQLFERLNFICNYHE